jgi:ankyrin repeat protein
MAEEDNRNLFEAISNGDLGALSSAIRHGADLNNAKNDDGETALTVVSYKGNRDMINKLLESGADINAKNGNGDTALMYVLNMNPDQEVVNLLVNKTKDLNVKGDEGDTALIRAAKQGNKDTVRLLIEKGADPTAEDANGKLASECTTDGEISAMLIEAEKSWKGKKA